MRFTAKLALVAVLTGCALAPTFADADAPKLTIEPYTFETFNGESVEAELGSFRVPENRQREGSRDITLKFVRFESTSKSPGSPIVYLAGGPGGSGSGTAKGTRFPLFMALRKYGDVIAYDQRGTGMSEPDLSCSEQYMLPFDRPTDPDEAGAIMADAVKRCFDRHREAGIDMDGYNSRESAADLNDLRQALGADKLTLWGISYGTHLALAYMKGFDAFADRAILAGLEGLNHSWKLPSDQQQLMEEIARLAKKDPATKAAMPDLLGTLEAQMERLAKEPQTVSLTHPTAGMTVGVTVGKFDLQFALSGMLRGPSSFADMADVVSRLAAGDHVALALAVAMRRMGNAPNAMSVAMDCASGASADWLARIEREAKNSLLADAVNFPFPEICAGAGMTDLGDGYRAPVSSDTPTLLISGTLDGRTPVSNGDEVMAGLSNAEHLIIVGAGHSDPLFLSSPRILETMEAFLAGKKVKTTRIKLPPVEFIAPRQLAEVDDAALKRYVGVYRVDGADTRRVTQAGSLLFTQRGQSRALPIRPSSDTAFFYEGSATHLEFELNADGSVAAMVVYHDGAKEGERAVKIE